MTSITQPKKTAVAYYRVSTHSQEVSGLGLEAQKNTVTEYCQKEGYQIIYEFTEIESGKKNDRKILAEAIKKIKSTNSTLIVAKLDRLTRDFDNLNDTIKSGINFIAIDSPVKDSSILRLFGVFANMERKAISQRTKDSLAVIKRKQKDIKNGIPHPDRDGKKTLGRAVGSVRANQDEINADLAALHHTRYLARIECLKGILFDTYGMDKKIIRRRIEESGYKSPQGNNITHKLIRQYTVDLGIEETVKRLKGL